MLIILRANVKKCRNNYIAVQISYDELFETCLIALIGLIKAIS